MITRRRTHLLGVDRVRWMLAVAVITMLGRTESHITEGRYSIVDPSTTNLIVPRKVHSNGSHLSHDLSHHSGPGDDARDDTATLHYHIELPTSTVHVELMPVDDFIAPQMVIERHKRDLRTRRRHIKNTKCHYQGHVRGDEHSKVALSACDGITGMIKTRNGDYYIEPSKHHPAAAAGHPHIVFQRSAVQQANRKQKAAMRKKRKRRRSRKKDLSNCGTRDPKRPVETRIEWQPQGKVIVQNGRRTRPNRNQHHRNKNNFAMNNNHIPIAAQKPLVHTRPKRSVSSAHHVEALIVADPSMVAFHQDVDVETYLLTIMNMVSSLYKDPAIGNLVKIIVVRIVLMEEEEAHPDFNVTHMAESTLHNFCSWQAENNEADNHPHHHDVAILITRKDICSKSAGCTTLGVANIGGMCKPDLSCSVNEDNGITLAHTITHEIGHNFGMHHDTEKTGCDSRVGPIVHVMTPSFAADTVQISWSNCSRRYITSFLDKGLGRCLDDSPSKVDFQYPELPPGAMYNANLQCRLQFNETDESVTVCSKPDEICSQLWCLVDGQCSSQMRPAAPGTNCGKHKWCQQQQCVEIEDQPDPVDGGWGNWNEWSKCTRDCGGGISTQSRQCDHPTPANGGSFCVGERIRYQVCNQDVLCPEGELGFRAMQCAEFNEVPYQKKLYDWLPFFVPNEPCMLYCTDVNDTFIVPRGEWAADGTSCRIGTNDRCIAGICRKVGCDWIVDSKKSVDECGICGGTGSTCTTIDSMYSDNYPQLDVYVQIAVVPAGSRHILIEEKAVSKNYISLGRANTNESYINADRTISMSGEFHVADSIGLYERDNEREKLQIPNPIQHDVSVNVLVLNRKNPGIRIKYTLTDNTTQFDPVFHWMLGDWAACSKTCGGGSQKRVPLCHQESKGMVDEENCYSNADNERPTEKQRNCNEDPCPAYWWIGPWQQCPATCRKHRQPQPMRQRSIICIDHNEIVLQNEMCWQDIKPDEFQPCQSDVPLCDGSDSDEGERDEDDFNTDDNHI